MVEQMTMRYAREDEGSVPLYIPNVVTYRVLDKHIDDNESDILSKAMFDESLVPYIYDKRARNEIRARWFRSMEVHALVRERYMRGEQEPQFEFFTTKVTVHKEGYEIRYEFEPIKPQLTPRGWLAQIDSKLSDDHPMPNLKTLIIHDESGVVATGEEGWGMRFGSISLKGYMNGKFDEIGLWVRLM